MRPEEHTPEQGLRELSAVLDEELNQMPEKWREPLCLYYLQSKNDEEAAESLGLSKRTLQLHKQQALVRLRLRLMRRGLSLSATLLAPALCQEALASAVSREAAVGLARAVIAAAAGTGPAGFSAQSIAMAQGAIQGAASAGKARFAAAMLVALIAAVGAGVALAPPRTSGERVASPQQPPKGEKAPPERDKQPAAAVLAQTRLEKKLKELLPRITKAIGGVFPGGDARVLKTEITGSHVMVLLSWQMTPGLKKRALVKLSYTVNDRWMGVDYDPSADGHWRSVNWDRPAYWKVTPFGPEISLFGKDELRVVREAFLELSVQSN
jgi:hypothetical protein